MQSLCAIKTVTWTSVFSGIPTWLLLELQLFRPLHAILSHCLVGEEGFEPSNRGAWVLLPVPRVRCASRF